jgi:hypothetical protein
MEDRVRCELVKLHTINKKEPMKNSWAGRDSPRKRKERNITR